MNHYKKLKKEIGIERYNHSMRVRDTAVKLAKIFNCDLDKAILAAVLHDCAKYVDKDYLLKQATKFGIMNHKSYKDNMQVVHAPLGAIIAKKEYGVKDKEVLNAICYHTTGRKKMTKLDKIIYVADFIEPKRDFDGIDRIRKLAKKDLDAAVLAALENSILFLVKKHSPIHLDTIKARNYLIHSGGSNG